MTKKRIEHKIAKDEEILRQLEKKELSEHGYWEKGYRQGRLSVLYDLLDEDKKSSAWMDKWTGGKRDMRTVKISCDRCGREITGYPVRIMPAHADRESGDIRPDTGEKLPEWAEKIQDKDFCEDCTEKIVRYALGGMKANPGFEQAVQEMMKKDAPPDGKGENEDKEPDAGRSKKEKPGRTEIDTGKVMALTKAGWKASRIADEMGINTQAVYDARYRLKKEGRL